MDGRQVRRVAWLLFGVAAVGISVAVAAVVVATALHAGTGARVLAALTWLVSSAFAWWAFRSSDGDALATASPGRTVAQRLQAWSPILGVVSWGVLLNFGDRAQMLGLAWISGATWPGLWWMMRAYATRPELRERLSSGRLTCPPERSVPADGVPK